MAPMKYEEQLKDKLEKRTMQPNTNSWQKLSDKLDTEAPKKHSKEFWYLGIAASIVAILLITNMFNNDTKNTVAPVIVDTENKEPTNTDAKSTFKTEKEKLTNNTETVAATGDKTKVIKAEKNEKNPVEKQMKNTQLKLVTNKTEKEIIAHNTEQQFKETIKDPLSFEEQKAQEVVAQIQSMQQVKDVTDAEIDALLSAAQRAIAFKKMYDESTKTINANALLLSVEDELEAQSFRSRVFEMLKTGYNEVKTVVAERNN